MENNGFSSQLLHFLILQSPPGTRTRCPLLVAADTLVVHAVTFRSEDLVAFTVRQAGATADRVTAPINAVIDSHRPSPEMSTMAASALGYIHYLPGGLSPPGELQRPPMPWRVTLGGVAAISRSSQVAASLEQNSPSSLPRASETCK